MKIINMYEGETAFSQLVEQVEHGEEVILTRAGKPVARVVPVQAGARRALGTWRGRVHMADDFDAPLPADESVAWTGGPG